MDDIQLISLVEGQPILYNKKRYDYKDQNKKCNAWQRIADSLEQEVEHVKVRWTCLRQRFSRERSKMASGAEAADEWELMKYMRFLDPAVAVRRSTSNYKKVKNPQCSEMEIIETLQPLEVYVNVSDEDVASDSCGTLSHASLEIFSPTSGEIFSPEAEIPAPEPKIFSPVPGTSKDDGDLVPTPTTRSLAKPKKRSAKSLAEEPPQKRQMFTALQGTLQGVTSLMARKQGQFVASKLKVMDEAEKKEKTKAIFDEFMS